MKFTDWKTELEKAGYVVTDDLVTTKRGDVLAGKDPYGGYFIMDSQIQDIVSKKPAPKKAAPKKKVISEEELEMVRARDEDGKFIADDPTTTDVNEAWVVKTVKKAVKKK
jgi:hypothetical protein